MARRLGCNQPRVVPSYCTRSPYQLRTQPISPNPYRPLYAHQSGSPNAGTRSSQSTCCVPNHVGLPLEHTDHLPPHISLYLAHYLPYISVLELLILVFASVPTLFLHFCLLIVFSISIRTFTSFQSTVHLLSRFTASRETAAIS
ncbi:hypothetical protein LIPSTDRAFT_238228 [Lipomyces starkeyi NRRL Y-11557]|uniref:Uncharacterized protein n=1 Tax=Lipomyces starkeyi NRRL Y-11557 TaxID=675824 RepID=A0A1E3QBK7_LIPST|nr:hypothetical protein LIPSTDRAFT_238228 [Lipomyces starkeyi NRRL Y-11557]